MPDFQERPARCLAAQPQGFHGGCEKCRNGGFTHYITMICPLYDHFSCELLLFVKFFGTLWSGNVAVVMWAARGQELFSSGQTLTVEACEPVPVSGIFGAIPMNAYKLSNRNQIWNIDVEWWCYIMYVYIYRKRKRKYCGWKKSCITLNGWNLVNNGINHLSTGAGFLPSIVCVLYMHLSIKTGGRYVSEH